MGRKNATWFVVSLVLVSCSAAPTVERGMGADSHAQHQALKGWAQASLERIQTLTPTVKSAHERRQQLQAWGYYDADPEGDLAWLQAATQDQQGAVWLLARLEEQVREGLYQLWFMTGHGEPIVGVPPERLVQQADQVLLQYEAFIKTSGTREIVDVIRAELEQLLAALDGPYHMVAMSVLEKWVRFEQDWSVTWEFGQLGPLTVEQQLDDTNRMWKWYRENVRDLRWSDQRQQFVPIYGGSFRR